MRILTRSFDNIPPESLGYTVYAISTTKPQQYRDMQILWLFAPPFEVQIEYNRTKDFDKLSERMTAALKQRASAIGDWVKAHSDEKICLVCWEGISNCHRSLVAEAVRLAAEKTGVDITIDKG